MCCHDQGAWLINGCPFANTLNHKEPALFAAFWSITTTEETRLKRKRKEDKEKKKDRIEEG